MRANIPSRMEYREFVRQQSRESKFKKNLREKLAKKLTGRYETELGEKKIKPIISNNEVELDSYLEAIHTVQKRAMTEFGEFFGSNMRNFTQLSAKVQENNIYSSNGRLIGFHPDPRPKAGIGFPKR